MLPMSVGCTRLLIVDLRVLDHVNEKHEANCQKQAIHVVTRNVEFIRYVRNTSVSNTFLKRLKCSVIRK